MHLYIHFFNIYFCSKNLYNTYTEREREKSVREGLPDCSDYESDDEDEGLVWEKRA